MSVRKDTERYRPLLQFNVMDGGLHLLTIGGQIATGTVRTALPAAHLSTNNDQSAPQTLITSSVEGFVMLSNNSSLPGLMCEIGGSPESSQHRRKREFADLSRRAHLEEV